MHLLRRRFKQCDRVPWALLQFIAKVQFRYEARSIAALINHIPMQADERADSLKELTVDQLRRLPLDKRQRLKESPLALHLIDAAGERGLTDTWRKALTIDATQQLRFQPLRPTARTPDWLLAFAKIAGQPADLGSS